ncbi:hypothetical protein DYB35_000991 [Aphanomyces astaci]|nr:hypothetical protein DYB35_000991 [Aphanomyces astaci]
MSFILNGGASLEDKGGLIRLPKLPPFQAPHASHRSTSSPNQQGSTTDERTRRVLQDQLDTLHQLRYEYHDNRPSHLHRSEDMVDEDDDRWDSDDSYDDVASTSSLDPNHRSSLGFSDTSGVFRRLLPSSIHDYDDAAHPSSSKHQAPFSTSWAQRKRNFELLQVTARLEDARQDYLGHIHASLEEDMRVQHHYQHLHPHAPLPTDAQVMAMRRQRAREVSMMYLFETNCRNAYEIGAFAFNHTTTSNVFKDSFSDVRGLLAALEAVLSLRKCWIVHVEASKNNELGDDEDVMTFHVGSQVYVRDNVGACKALLRPELHWLLPHLMHARERGFVSVQAALQCRYRTFDVKSMYIHVDVAALGRLVGHLKLAGLRLAVRPEAVVPSSMAPPADLLLKAAFQASSEPPLVPPPHLVLRSSLAACLWVVPLPVARRRKVPQPADFRKDPRLPKAVASKGLLAVSSSKVLRRLVNSSKVLRRLVNSSKGLRSSSKVLRRHREPAGYPPQQQQPPQQGGVPSGDFNQAGYTSNAPMPSTGQLSEAVLAAQCDPRYMRLTVNAIPHSQEHATKSALPLGVIIQPLAKPDKPLDVVNFGASGVVRCKACRTYINPFVQWVDNGRRGAVEIVASSEYMMRPPTPPVYVFVIDVSAQAVASGMLAVCADTIKRELDNLPGAPRTRVGFITFDNAVHFYNLKAGLTSPQMMVVPDINELFIPIPDELLVNLR